MITTLGFGEHMDAAPTGLLLTMMTAQPGGDDEFNDWANTEHIPERRVIPGFRTAIRFENRSVSPRYLTLYDLEDVAVLQTDAYQAIAGDNLSPWSKRILARATDRWRFAGSNIGAESDRRITGANGPVTELLLAIWRGMPSNSDKVIEDLLVSRVAAVPGVTQVRGFVAANAQGFDYVGIAESALPFSAQLLVREGYSLGAKVPDQVQTYSPVQATRS